MIDRCGFLLVLVLTGCAAPAPAPVADAVSEGPKGKFEPAPMPHVAAARSQGLGSIAMTLPPKMPLGTGAVPVGNGSVRGSFVTGVRQNF